MVEIRIARLKTEELDGTYGEGNNNNESFTFIVRNLQSLNIGLRTPISPMPLPEEGADENVLVKVEGNSQTIRVVFVVHELSDPTDSSQATCFKDGTSSQLFYNSNVEGQVKWLTKVMEAKGLEHHHKIQIRYAGKFGVTNGYMDYRDLTYFGFITGINVDIQGTSPATATVTVDFIQGNTITGIDDDVPSTPNSLTVAPTGSTDASITVSWGVPSDAGGTGSISKYAIEYTKQDSVDGGDIQPIEYVESGTSKVLTGGAIESGNKYTARVAAIDSSGKRGRWSGWVTSSSVTT